MSCHIVSNNHISAIIRFACINNLKAGWTSNKGYAYEPGREQEACDLLYDANVRSVNARYKEDAPTVGCIYNSHARGLLPIEVIKAIQGLEYQCDEWEGFEDSKARYLLCDIAREAVSMLPGYEAARTWSID
jgi:hypothetical protein